MSENPGKVLVIFGFYCAESAESNKINKITKNEEFPMPQLPQQTKSSVWVGLNITPVVYHTSYCILPHTISIYIKRESRIVLNSTKKTMLFCIDNIK